MRKIAAVAMLLSCLGAAVAAEAAIPAPACASPAQSIREQGYVPINGIEQWITITGARCGNPVILVIHGGPGNPLSPFADAMFQGWEQHYTLVQWDQRGAGRTYSKNRPLDNDTLTLELMRDDGIAVANHVRQRLGQQKMILMGSSWGSILGVYMAKARPELFHAYVGTAQVVDARANVTGMYREVMALAQGGRRYRHGGQTDGAGQPAVDRSAQFRHPAPLRPQVRSFDNRCAAKELVAAGAAVRHAGGAGGCRGGRRLFVYPVHGHARRWHVFQGRLAGAWGRTSSCRSTW